MAMLNNQPLLSVIVPTYNRASFLPGCIESLRASGVDDLEIIIVDDGSSDNTPDVVATLQPGLIYIRQENKGPSAARNTGIRASRGRFLSYLDSDDYWIPGVPRRVLEAKLRHPELDVVFTDARMGNPQKGYVSWFDHAGRQEFRDLPTREAEPGLRLLDPVSFYQLLLRRNPICTDTVILRRETVLDHGMFNEGLVAAEDWEVWLRMAHHARYGYWHEPMAIYTLHPGGLTTDTERMSKGWRDAMLAHRTQVPDLPPEEAALRAEAVRNLLFNRAYLAYDRGDYCTAHARFADALREGGLSARAAAYWCATVLPGPLAAWLRRLKRSIGA